MPYTYKLISSYTVGSGGIANIDFTSIPDTYTDLCLKVSLRDTNNSPTENIRLTFNGVGGTSYTERLLYGSGNTTASSYVNSSAAYSFYQYSSAALATSGTFGNGEFYITKYAGSSNKVFSVDSVAVNNSATNSNGLNTGVFNNSSPITSIRLSSPAGSFVQNSTAYLYGIKNS